MADHPSAARFPTTRWSRVVAAGGRANPEDRDALAELCRAYWYPLYALVRRKGYGPDDAQDLTQEYFARLLEKRVLAGADARKGRFRAFLRTDCAYFLANRHDRDVARKRGGGAAVVSLDARDPEGRYRAEPADRMTPERLFDRAWALTLLERVLAALRLEYQAAGGLATFEALKPLLTDGPRSLPLAAVAERLGSTEGAVRVAAHRLRRRYRALLEEQIAATVADPAEVGDEIRDLFDALGA